MPTYTNLSNVTYTFYGVIFEPRSTRFVPFIIDHPKFFRRLEPCPVTRPALHIRDITELEYVTDGDY